MQRLPTVLLRHDLPGGSHHDWLLADPRTADSPEARLWTARVGPPSTHWAGLGVWDLDLIAAHRRVYLTYEGPLTPGPAGEPRGSVVRVDQGWFTAELWTDTRMLIDLHLRACRGRIEIERTAPDHWQARFIGGPATLRR
jgi:hypothetical protein